MQRKAETGRRLGLICRRRRNVAKLLAACMWRDEQWLFDCRLIPMHNAHVHEATLVHIDALRVWAPLWLTRSELCLIQASP